MVQMALSARPPLPPIVAWAVVQRTNRASVPGIPQDLPERLAARVPGRCQERPAAPRARAPSSEGRWPREALGKRVSDLREAQGREGTQRKSPQLVSALPVCSDHTFAPPTPPPCSQAPGNRRTRGSTGPGRVSKPHCACSAVWAGGGGGSRQRAARGGN